MCVRFFILLSHVCLCCLLHVSVTQGQQRAGVMSKQSKLVRYIIANPPKHKGGTQHIGQQGYQVAEDAIAAAEAAKVTATAAGSSLNGEDESGSDSVDSDSSDDAVGDDSSSVFQTAVECKAHAPAPEPEPEQRAAVHQLLDTALAKGGWKSVISTLKTDHGFHRTCDGTDAAETADGLLVWLQRVGGAAIAEVQVSAETDKVKSSVSKAVAKVLYTLYELDLVEASGILGWADRCAVEQPLVSQAVHPVVAFLSADANEDESSSTGEDTADD